MKNKRRKDGENKNSQDFQVIQKPAAAGKTASGFLQDRGELAEPCKWVRKLIPLTAPPLIQTFTHPIEIL